MHIHKASFPSTLEQLQGACPKSLGQLSRIVRVSKLEIDEANSLAATLSQSPFVFGDTWGSLEEIIQDPGVLTFATVTNEEKLESISIASCNGIAPCRDLQVRSACASGVSGYHPRSICEKDGILQVVYVDSKAQSQGIGGAHLLAQLHALKEHGCSRAWAFFNMHVGRAGRNGKETFWDKRWWEALNRLGFSERGPLGSNYGQFHAKCVEFTK